MKYLLVRDRIINLEQATRIIRVTGKTFLRDEICIHFQNPDIYEVIAEDDGNLDKIWQDIVTILRPTSSPA